jgi:hypothetical protein
LGISHGGQPVKHRQDSQELVKKWAMFVMFNSFRGWKGDMVRGHMLKGIKPEWKHFPNQHQFWDELIHFKLSKAEQVVSEKKNQRLI